MVLGVAITVPSVVLVRVNPEKQFVRDDPQVGAFAVYAQLKSIWVY